MMFKPPLAPKLPLTTKIRSTSNTLPFQYIATYSVHAQEANRRRKKYWMLHAYDMRVWEKYVCIFI